MIAALLKRWRLRRLQHAIKSIEGAGLAVVQVKRGEDAIYLVSRSGTYRRFDKVKKAA